MEYTLLAADAHPELLDTLEKMEHPAYEDWVKRGSPRGMNGVIIRGKKDKFLIQPYNQHYA
ncbi:hypothetical protein LCGC14_0370180 [marine sediment metagenome]|uniref:Uncharacterized protein n=1 Tax=marine sediment metagenome TaxID=412755 RepID=A0A0F9TBF2_9ZZZZ